MEERWLAARNREVVDQIAGEERRAALREWSERRARVEEEIARNAEVIRFQSDLQRRAYAPLPYAQEDADVSALRTAERGDGTGVQTSAMSSATLKASEVGSAGDEASNTASEAGDAPSAREELQVRFADEIETPASEGSAVLMPSRPPLTPRLAQLRKINARYLQRPEGGNVATPAAATTPEARAAEPSAGAAASEEQLPMSTHAGGRMQDASDVVAAVCETWREASAPELVSLESGDTMTHRQIRYKQMMEVELVKRAFARSRTPFSEEALEGALVAPSRGLVGDATPLFTTPGGMRSPFPEDFRSKKKKKASPRRRRSSVKSSSPRSPALGQRRSQSSRR